MKKILFTLAFTFTFALTAPAYAEPTPPFTSQHVFKPGEKYTLELQACKKGRHPIVMAHALDRIKYPNLTTRQQNNADGSHFTVDVDEAVEGIFAQFCHPKDIRPYFKKIKANKVK